MIRARLQQGMKTHTVTPLALCQADWVWSTVKVLTGATSCQEAAMGVDSGGVPTNQPEWFSFLVHLKGATRDARSIQIQSPAQAQPFCDKKDVPLVRMLCPQQLVRSGHWRWDSPRSEFLLRNPEGS